MKSKAYSILRVKSMDDDTRIISGVASTPRPDRVGDIVEPQGVKYKTPLPLLLYHDHDKPVGNVTDVSVSDEGIKFTAMLPRIEEAGALRDRVDEAWQSIKYSLLAAVSIGFRAENDGIEILDSGGLRFNAWEWYELSLVAVPAQPDAVIDAKSMRAGDIKALMTRGVAIAPDKPPAKTDRARVWAIKL